MNVNMNVNVFPSIDTTAADDFVSYKLKREDTVDVKERKLDEAMWESTLPPSLISLAATSMYAKGNSLTQSFSPSSNTFYYISFCGNLIGTKLDDSTKEIVTTCDVEGVTHWFPSLIQSESGNVLLFITPRGMLSLCARINCEWNVMDIAHERIVEGVCALQQCSEIIVTDGREVVVVGGLRIVPTESTTATLDTLSAFIAVVDVHEAVVIAIEDIATLSLWPKLFHFTVSQCESNSVQVCVLCEGKTTSTVDATKTMDEGEDNVEEGKEGVEVQDEIDKREKELVQEEKWMREHHDSDNNNSTNTSEECLTQTTLDILLEETTCLLQHQPTQRHISLQTHVITHSHISCGGNALRVFVEDGDNIAGVDVAVDRKDLQMAQVCTLPAMAFVLQSKQQKQFVCTSADSDKTWVVEATGRVYVYGHPAAFMYIAPLEGIGRILGATTHNNKLYICTSSSLYALSTSVKGEEAMEE
eukprot:m.112398 g.112398  ORF g.112398 m.112398 type:complete len:473 (-) comp12786_c0_seq1:51-1469(-)